MYLKKNNTRSIFVLSILSILLNINIAVSQNTILQDLDNTFQDLNIYKLNTGILLNKVISMSNIYKYNGSGDPDTLCSYKNLKQIYYELFNGSYSKSSFKTLDSVEKYSNNLYNNNQIPLLLLNYDYNVLKANAFNNGMLSYVADKFEDNTAYDETPFETRKTFAFSTSLRNTHLNILNFYLDENLILTNSALSISSIQVDFDDGLGLKTIFTNSNFPVTYSTSGDKIIKIKVTYSDASILNASTLIHINNDLPTSHSPLASSNQFISVTPSSFSYHFTIQPVNFFTSGNSCATIQMGKDPSGATHTCITNPLIFVEGVDFSSLHLGKHGDLGYIDFINFNPDYPQIVLAPFLLTDLNNDGYDIVYLDFNDGAADMEYNALTLVSLINGINNIKCGSEENVVIGASMGGQVARYALAYMESKKMKTCTREYVSFDSPQKGANIPLGLQYFVQFFADAGSAQAQSVLDDKLSRPAAQQLLIYHYIGAENNIIRQQWLTKRDAIGYPLEMRKTAVANGSAISTNQGFASGAQLIDYNYDLFYTIHLKGNVWAVPGYNSDPGVVKIFHGKRPLHPDDIREAPFSTSTPPWDNAPGSPHDAVQGFDGPQFSDFIDWGMGLDDGTYLGYVHALVPKTTFIPTISALDINTTDLFYNIQANVIDRNNPMPGVHPFDAVYFQSTNQQHVEITHPAAGQTNTNSEWIINELPKNKNILSSTLSSNYNFGFIKKTLYSVVVNSGGVLAVNLNANTDYGANPVPPPNSTYNVHTNQCGAVVEVLNGGNFIIGQKIPNNKGIVKFESGSTLIIRNGGKLIINDNSRLLIEEGAILIIDQGAKIQLLGDNAVLEIKGDLKLTANAIFTFTHPGSSSGYVKFSRDTPWDNLPHIFGATGCSIELKGQNKNDKILEIAQDILFVSQFQNISLFKIETGEVEFTHPGKTYISVDAPTRFIADKFISTGSDGKVAVWGQPICQIDNCLFDKVAVEGYLFMYGTKLIMNYTEIKNCGSPGLYTQGKSTILNGVNFNTNADGWLASLLSQNSKIINSKFNDNASFGASIIASPIETDFTSCKIKNNTDYGLDLLGPTLAKIRCGEVNKNLVGFSVGATASLSMNTTLAGGYVDAQNNIDNTILLTYASGLDINNGYNDLRVNTGGTALYPNNIYNLSQCTNFANCPVEIAGYLKKLPGTPVVANNNKWQTDNTKPLVTTPISATSEDKFTEVFSSFDGTTRLHFTDVAQSDKAPCGFWDPAPCPTCPASFLEVCPTCNTINTTSFINKKTNAAVKEAMAKMDSTIIDGHKEAVNMFHQVLKYPIPTPTEGDKFVTNIAERELVVSLAQAIENNQVPVSDSTLAPEVLKAIEIQNDKITQANIDNKYLDKLYGNIEKALIYYVAEQRAEAITILDNVLTFVQPSEQDYVTYIRCLIYNEQLLKSKQINQVEFLNSVSLCTPPNRGIQRSASYISGETTNEETDEYKISLFPNPASDQLFLEYNLTDIQQARFIIYDITGKILYESILKGGSRVEEITDLHLSSGIYLYKIITSDNNILKQSKLTIIK